MYLSAYFYENTNLYIFKVIIAKKKKNKCLYSKNAKNIVKFQ